MQQTDEHAEAWTRRSFFRVTAGAAALLAAGGLIARCTDAEDGQVERSKLKALSPAEFRVVVAFSSRMLATDDPAYPSPDALDVGIRIDALIAKCDAQSRADLKQLLALIEHALPLRIGRASRFSALTPRDQDAVLAAMMTSSVALLRGAFDALKGLCMMAYFRDARAWAAIGYDGPLVARPTEGWVAASSLVRPR